MTITLLDGGLGQELMARSNAAPTPLWSAHTMRDEPDLVKAVHMDYFEAGAQIATTNSYVLHRDRLVQNDCESEFESLNLLACEIANQARDEFGAGLIAGSMGPTGRSYRPDLALDVEQGAIAYAEIAKLQAPLVDFFLLETMASLQQAEGAIQGAQVPGKPVWVSLTVDDDDGTKLRSGEDVNDAIMLAERLQVNAILINCSTPEAVTSAVGVMQDCTIAYGAYANGFTKISDSFKQIGATVDALQARHDLGPNEYANFAQTWADTGATIIGGCCEVGPAHIRELARRFA